MAAYYIITGVLATVSASLLVAVILLWRMRQRLAEQNRQLEAERTAERTAMESGFAAERAAMEAKFRAEAASAAEKHDAERMRLEHSLRDSQIVCATLKAKLEVAQNERKQSEEVLKLEFKNLANNILSEQTRHFRETNKDEIDKLLKPFKENIDGFRDRVEKIYSFENEQRGSLRGELNRLMELNRRITDETANLTKALKGDSKVQGDTGEMLLETILENSNLVRGIHYESQYNIKDEEGNNLRPDVVVFLPEGKRIVVDSKMSLKAYLDYVGAEDAESAERALTAHLQSIRRHFRELGAKNYQTLMESPDFVIMFIPSESAFLTAMRTDNSIWSEAYERKVIISSPTNLFALLKLVDDLWKRNEQSKNTAEIVKYGTKLYDQFVNFVTALESVGQSLDKAKTSYDEAYKRLCTGNDNLIRTSGRLREMGLPTKKRMSRQAIESAGADTDSDEEQDEEV